MKQIETYEARQSGGLLLNANESSEGFDPEILEQLHRAVEQIPFNRYPDDECTSLVQSFADWQGLEPEQVLAGNGSDAVLGLLISLFTGRDRKLVTWDPDFSMYDYYATLQDAEIVKIPVGDVEALVAAGKDADLVMISNPNNPTGMTLSREEMRQVLAALPQTPVVVDEAYMDFSDQSLLPEVEDWPNLYVTRTLSKAMGAAGLRLGFLAGSRQNMERIRPYRVPYSINAFSQAAGTVLLENAERFEARTETIRQERERVFETLKALGLPVQPSGANFLFLQGDGMEALGRNLEERGVIVRTWPGREQIRITISVPEENDQLLAAVKDSLAAGERKENGEEQA